MRGRTGRTLARVVLFTGMCLVFLFALVTVFGQFRFDSRATYSAVFTNVSGLKGGNFVRIAGVEVGKVKNLTLHKDGTVTVDFAIDKGLPLTEGTRAAVRYENLIGDRYLALEEGPGSVRRLQPGQTIPLARTSPALDVDALIGGFRPLFRALDPDQVNALSGELLKVFQGQGGTISSVLSQTSALTTTLAGRDQLIGLAGLRHARGMIVRKDQRRGVVLERLPHDLPGVHAGTVDGAAEHLFEMNQPVAVVEVQAAEHLVWSVAQLRGEELPGGGGCVERRPGAQRFAVVTSRQLKRRHQRGISSRPQAAPLEQ